MKRAALCAFLALALWLVACDGAGNTMERVSAAPVASAGTSLLPSATAATSIATVKAAGDHSLKWVGVVGTLKGGDCTRACLNAGLSPILAGTSNSVLCAWKHGAEYFDSGIKVDGDGCYYSNSKDGNKPYRAWARNNGFYQCGCAKSNTAAWRAKGGCLSTERNSYYTCRVRASNKAYIGWVSTKSLCVHVQMPGDKATKGSPSYDVLCDKLTSSGIPAGRNGPITLYPLTGNSCRSTCQAKGKVEVGSGTAGISLCAEDGYFQVNLGTASSGVLAGNSAVGCFFSGVLASDADRKSKCPWKRDFSCYCQSTVPNNQPVWVPKARALPRGGSPSSVCKKWTTLPEVKGWSLQYVCRTKVNGQWVLGTSPVGPEDHCTTIIAMPDFYSVCGMHITGDYDILCERT